MFLGRWVEMGKIFIKFNLSNMKAANNGTSVPAIPFRELKQIIDSLPDETYITSIHSAIFMSIASYDYTVEAENNHFMDGTEIVGNWTRNSNTINGTLKAYNIFSGVTIVNPPTKQTTQATTGNVSLGGNGTGVGGSGIYTTPPANAGTWGTWSYTFPSTSHISFSGVPVGIDTSSGQITVTLPTTGKCTCGAEKVGGMHSSYCDKK
jgi:hypothetical protein